MAALAKLLVILVVLSCGSTALAQSARTEHTLKLDDPAYRPAATLSDVAWLAGSWTGTAFGSTFEEVWNPPSAGSMVGLFKLLSDGEVNFYEIMLLVETEGSLALKVRHFNPDFTAWEEKDEDVTFRLVRVDDEAVHFSGLSFYRVDKNRINGYIVMRDDEGVTEEPLVYRRVGSLPD